MFNRFIISILFISVRIQFRIEKFFNLLFILLKITFNGKVLSSSILDKFKIFLLKFWMREQDCSVHQAIVPIL